jgi:hypothetical protein
LTHHSDLPDLDWLPLLDWTKRRFIFIERTPGIVRFSRRGEAMFFASETRCISHSCRFARPKRNWEGNPGARDVYVNRRELLLHYAEYDDEPWEIDRVRDELIDRFKPAFNRGERNPNRN